MTSVGDDLSSWVPAGLSFLSGLPAEKRKRRAILAIQAFVDDTGTGGSAQGPALVLFGLIAPAERWLRFSQAWQKCLDTRPKDKVFKTQIASHWKHPARVAKLRRLAQIINDTKPIALYCAVDLQAFDSLMKSEPKPLNDSYYLTFHWMIRAVCNELMDQGLTERFEIIFDENKISGLRAKKFYPLIRRIAPDDIWGILPVESVMRPDDEFRPLQACDMVAWVTRRRYANLEHRIGWLADELGDVVDSRHSLVIGAHNLPEMISRSHEIKIAPEVFQAMRDNYEL